MNYKLSFYLLFAFLLGAFTYALIVSGMGGHSSQGGWMMPGTMMGPGSGPMMNEPMKEGRMGTDSALSGPQGHGAMMDMMVSSEREFIELMIPHHEEAIATAKEGSARGATTEAIRQLYENIIASQTTEVALMREWYEEQYGEPYEETGEYQPMMRDLTQLSGQELDRIFLSDMIMHHMGAIMMARSVQPHLEHEVLAELSANIIRNQSVEIVSMREMLRGL